MTVFTRAPKPGAGATRGVIHQFAIDAASRKRCRTRPAIPEKDAADTC